MTERDPEPSDSRTFRDLVGGPRGALESTLAPAAFIITYVATGDSIAWSVGVALVFGGLFAGWRIAEGKKPTRALSALLLVAISAYFAVRTGSAAAFFWPRVLVNVVSALAFAISILVRWPLLGVIVGPIVGTRMQWRKDPDLLRAYGRASWIWVALCLVRAAILIPLIEQNALWGLAISGAFFYLLVIATIISSWIVVKRSLPADHLGLRHPHIPAEPPSDRGDGPA